MKLRYAALATSALVLTLAAAPQAMAKSYSFSTTINSAINNGSGGANSDPGPLTSGARAFSATFTTDAPTGATTGIYNINSIIGGTLGAPNPFNQVINVTSNYPAGSPGAYFGQINLATGRITGLDFTFARNSATNYASTPWEMSFLSYTTGGVGRVSTFDSLGDGGVSAFTLTQIPEIDGGMLPRAIGVLAGVFLMLFGRKKQEDLA